MVEGYPAVAAMEPCTANKEVRFNSVRPNNVRIPAARDLAHLINNAMIEATVFPDDVNFNSIECESVKKSI